MDSEGQISEYLATTKKNKMFLGGWQSSGTEKKNKTQT